MMKRQLTSYESSGDPEQDERIAAIMKAEGCTAPVAKNMLKFAKLGIGPVPSGMEKKPADLPVSSPYDRKAAMMEREKKQRQMEEDDSEPDLGAFLGGAQKKVGGPKTPGSAKQGIGMARLGPVLARQEEVDPLFDSTTFEERRRKAEEEQKKEEDRKQRAQHRREEEARLSNRSKWGSHEDEGSDVDYESLPQRFPTEKDKKKVAQQQQPEEGRRRRKKRKDRRKRGRDWEDENEDDDEGPHDRRAAKERSVSRSRSRSGSPEPMQPSKGSLMSEEQILKTMKRRPKSSRNAEHAQDRIQKELKEWEARKQENSEFWKAPKFCLCFSAETTKNIRKV